MALQERVKWLESIVRINCPEIDLDHGPTSSPDLDANHTRIDFTRLQGPPGTQTTDESTESTASTASSQFGRSLPLQSQGRNEPRQPIAVSNEQSQNLAHEIGLVSLAAGTDPKYIGPSSGYFFAKLILDCASRQGQNSAHMALHRDNSTGSIIVLPRDTLQAPPIPLPSDLEYMIQLSEIFFETVHVEYPFIHQPSHLKLIHHVHTEKHPSPVAAFQVNMVLAIAATIHSRRLRIHLPGEGYCANAMTYFGQFSIENSLQGLQSLLLLLVYTLQSPSMALNVWYLNYQCIAAVLDLGLQRDIRSSKVHSILDREMRTRVFWVIYTLDRTVATIMGRPIGLRDEACEMRVRHYTISLVDSLDSRLTLLHQWPTDVQDCDLTETSLRARAEGQPPTHMSHSIHLFRLAQLNSEIKYVLHSISRQPLPYTYPNIPDVDEWKQGITVRLNRWKEQIPLFDGNQNHLSKLCEIRYHGVMMLLLRPCPTIPKPTTESLILSHKSATSSLHLYDQLYRDDLLLCNWITVHSLFLSTITMLYCIWAVPEVAAQTRVDVLMADMKAVSNILSATGEHWSEAKRSRDVLDDLSSVTTRWIIASRTASSGNANAMMGRRASPLLTGYQGAQVGLPSEVRLVFDEQRSAPLSAEEINAGSTQTRQKDINGIDQHSGLNYYTSLYGEPSLEDEMGLMNPLHMEAIMQGIFNNDFQSIFDIELEQGMDEQMGDQFGMP
jgi:hypothetical protein